MPSLLSMAALKSLCSVLFVESFRMLCCGDADGDAEPTPISLRCCRHTLRESEVLGMKVLGCAVWVAKSEMCVNGLKGIKVGSVADIH